ncbi:MAG: MFS transporter [Anaerolineaceae bacterium]|nr:MFS transporter [Anaerolineaceae bacterium]
MNNYQPDDSKNIFQQLVEHPLFFAVYLPGFLIFFARGILSPIMPLYMGSFDVSYSMIGLMLSMNTIGKITFGLPSGVWSPRLGAKKSMLIGLAITGICLFGLVIARTPLQVIILQFVSGLGSALYFNARLSYAAGATENKNRGRSFSAIGGLNRFSMIISPFVGGVLANYLGLRVPFAITGAFFLLSLLIVWIKVEENEQIYVSNDIKIRDVFRVIFDQRDILARAGIGAILLSLVRAGRGVLIPIYGADILGLSASQIGIILSAASVLDLLNFYTAGTIMDRYGRRWAAIPCVGIMGLGMALVPFTGGFVGLLLVTMLIGLGNGFGSGIMMTYGADLAPEEQRGEFVSAWLVLLDIGGASSSLVVGWVSELLSLNAAAFTFFGLGILGVLSYLYLVPETRKEKHHLQNPAEADA